MLPIRIVVAYNAPIGELLVPGQGVIEQCDRYNRALDQLRALRDRFERCFGPRSRPAIAETAHPALSRLEVDIHARQTARLGAHVVPLRILQGEIEFWESYHTYLASFVVRSERAAEAPQDFEDTADMDPAD
jgi:hypothetical protein